MIGTTLHAYIYMYWPSGLKCCFCLYVGVDYTYIDVNALAQGIKSFLASHVWYVCIDVCMYVGIYVCTYVLMYDYIYVLFVGRV